MSVEVVSEYVLSINEKKHRHEISMALSTELTGVLEGNDKSFCISAIRRSVRPSQCPSHGVQEQGNRSECWSANAGVAGAGAPTAPCMAISPLVFSHSRAVSSREAT